jgi:hypothetical protein
MAVVGSGVGGSLPVRGGRLWCVGSGSIPPLAFGRRAMWWLELEPTLSVRRPELVVVHSFPPPPTTPLATGCLVLHGTGGILVEP